MNRELTQDTEGAADDVNRIRTTHDPLPLRLAEKSADVKARGNTETIISAVVCRHGKYGGRKARQLRLPCAK